MKPVFLVSATPLSKEEFWKTTPLAKSLEMIASKNCFYHIVYGNKTGLPLIYNSMMRSPESENTITLFVHHDVSIEDAFLVPKLNEAIKQFDIVGLAGGSSVEIKSPALWHLMTDRETWSGAVAHKFPDGSTRAVSFGPTPKRCLILDGLFLALNTPKIVGKGLWFDPNYMFHHYDVQLGLDANGLGIKLGTWPIWVVHSGLGDSYQSEAWRKSEEHFLKTNS
jgi:hypothetical protein